VTEARPLAIAVCLKWAGIRPEVDATTGAARDDVRWFAASPADCAALETALQLAARWDATVTVVVASNARPDALLKEALALGAIGVIDIDHDATNDSWSAARALHEHVDDADLVICGDYSSDRGSGSVPAYLAHLGSRAQALGLIRVTPTAPGELEVVRRLDGGRREVLALGGRAVISVEGSVATLRRASLKASLAVRASDIVRARPNDSSPAHPIASVARPWRPRPRTLPAPAGTSALERLRDLTGTHSARNPPQRLELIPNDAAAAIVDQLTQWGYLTERTADA
jgi:electron transfer flavoprotein beta subunit